MEPVKRTFALALAVLAAAFLLAVGASLVTSLQVERQSNKQWCDTLGLLTSHPVPRPTDPGANPSREQNWLFYQDLRQLSRSFGC